MVNVEVKLITDTGIEHPSNFEMVLPDWTPLSYVWCGQRRSRPGPCCSGRAELAASLLATQSQAPRPNASAPAFPGVLTRRACSRRGHRCASQRCAGAHLRAFLPNRRRRDALRLPGRRCRGQVAGLGRHVAGVWHGGRGRRPAPVRRCMGALHGGTLRVRLLHGTRLLTKAAPASLPTGRTRRSAYTRTRRWGPTSSSRPAAARSSRPSSGPSSPPRPCTTRSR